MFVCCVVFSLWRCWMMKRRQTTSWEPNSTSAGTELPLETSTSLSVQVHTHTDNISFLFIAMSSTVDSAPSSLLFPLSFSLVPSNLTSLPTLPQRELTSAASWTRPCRRTRSWRIATTPTVTWLPCFVSQRTSSTLPSPPPTRPRHCRAARSVHL